jgi:hypothetical protein
MLLNALMEYSEGNGGVNCVGFGEYDFAASTVIQLTLGAGEGLTYSTSL